MSAAAATVPADPERVSLYRLPRAVASLEPIAFWGLVAALLLASGVFYRDRLFADVAHFLFQLANNGEFVIAFRRWPSALTQWPALTAVHLGAPLKVVAILYSVSLMGYGCTLAILVRGVFRDRPCAWAMLVMLLAIITHCFIWQVDELAQGLVSSFVLAAALRDTSRRIVASVFAFAGALVTCYFHPLAIPCAMFILLLAAIARPRAPWAVWGAGAAAVGIALIDKWWFGAAERAEAGKLDFAAMRNNFSVDFAYFYTEHRGAVLLLILGVGILLLHRRLVGALLLFASVVGLYVVVFSRYHVADTAMVYLWHMCLPLYALPLLAWLQSNTREFPGWQAAGGALVVAGFAAGSVYGATADVEWFRERIAGIWRRISEPDQGPVYRADDRSYAQITPFGWAAIDESLIASSLTGPDFSKLLLPEKKISWHPIYKAELNKQYFCLVDDIERWAFAINSTSDTASIAAYVSTQVELQVELASESGTARVTVHNRGKDRLSSRSSNAGPVQIVCIWNGVREHAGERLMQQFPLEADVFLYYNLPVKAPPNADPASLTCQLVVGNRVLKSASVFAATF